MAAQCESCVLFFSQARESASLREILQAERGAHSSELEQLRSSLLKLQIQLQENANTAPLLADKQEEDMRRAEEKAAQEILQLTQVSHVSHTQLTSATYFYLFIYFKRSFLARQLVLLILTNFVCLLPVYCRKSKLSDSREILWRKRRMIWLFVYRIRKRLRRVNGFNLCHILF